MIGKSVKFIRKNGRIIPILVGGAVGATLGSAVKASNQYKKERLDKAIQSNPESTLALIKKSGMKDINLISSKRDVNKHFGGASNILLRKQLEPHIKMVQKGLNAAAMRHNGKDFLIVGKKANRDVVGHELGHIRDFRKNGKLGFFETGLMGALTGGTLKREKTAWKMSPFCSKHRTNHKCPSIQQKALSTYEAGQSGSRFGAAAGAGAGLAYSLLRAIK